MPGQIGNKGGGRKSAYEEEESAAMVKQAVLGKGYTKQEVEDMAKGRRNILKTMIIKAYSGNERCMVALLNKVVPDLQRSDNTNRNVPGSATDIPRESRGQFIRQLLQLADTRHSGEGKDGSVLPEQVHSGVQGDGGESPQTNVLLLPAPREEEATPAS